MINALICTMPIMLDGGWLISSVEYTSVTVVYKPN